MPLAKSVATTRQSEMPSESAEASQRVGGPMIAGSRRRPRTFSLTPSGIMPVAVAPPGASRFTVTAVPARSAAMTCDNESVAAREGPYGAKPARRVVGSLS